MAQQSIPYAGYPAEGVSAIRAEWAGDHFGPANYQAGGYNMNAQALLMSRIEVALVSARSQSANYFAQILYPANSGNTEVAAVPPSYVTVKWFTAANSVEVANNTNLGGEVVQLTARGLA